MPTTILRAPGFSYYTSIGSLHFKDVLSKIGEAHPQSALARQTTKRSIKQIKTEQAIAKNKRRIKGLK